MMQMGNPQLTLKLYQLTQNLMERLYEAEFEELELFIDERQILVDDVIRQFSTTSASVMEKAEIERILQHDPEIIARMNALRLEAQDFLQKRSQAKIQRSAYEAGYTPDSFLMDRKK